MDNFLFAGDLNASWMETEGGALNCSMTWFGPNFGSLPELPGELIVEQIIAYVRRIVQIMIEATDMVQMLYRGHPSRK